MLGLLLNNVTIIIAAILFLGLLIILILKRKQLTKNKKTILNFLCSIVAIYFIFVGIVIFAFGNTHPLGEPSPTFDTEPYDSFSFSQLRPEQMQIYEDKLIFSSDNSELKYVVTWTPSGCSAEVGLISEDGTEYFAEAVGGSSKASITEIPAGSYQLIIRNSKGNLEFKSDRDRRGISGAVAFWIV